MATIDTGRVLAERYRLIARRASGATATVWEAHDEFLRRNVAVKILHEHLGSDPDLRGRFIDEAHTAATVSHPALVAIFDSIDDPPGLVLEWIDGPDLRHRLDEGPLTFDEIRTLGITLCGGLAALHHHGLVHRDVKPANILLTRDRNAKLTDFGIATSNAGDRTATGIVLGTAKYLSPEQVRGTGIDQRTDVFGLAAVLYEAFAGRPPWVRDGDLPTALARLDDDPDDLRALRPDGPPDLAVAIMHGLAREPAERWRDADAFAGGLAGTAPAPAGLVPPASALPPPPPRRVDPSAEGDTTMVGKPPTAPPRPLRPRRRHWPRVVGLMVALAIAALGFSLLVANTDDPGQPGDQAAPIIEAATAFDPEGSGPPGEHDELAPAAIDGDPSTAWTTERYDDRGLGAKSGVGLVVSLASPTRVESVVIETTGAQNWAADVRVADGVDAATATGIDDFGPAAGAGSALSATGSIPVEGSGDRVVIWLTDLGDGPPPISLAISEITIR